MELEKIVGVNKLLNRFKRDVSDKYDYHFKLVGISDYELTLTFTAKSKVMNSVFKQVKKVLTATQLHKFKKLKDSNPDLLESFDVPKEFNNRVHTAVQKNIKEIDKKVLNKDGVYILRSYVSNCHFSNSKDKTYITVKVGGQYVKK